MRTFISTPRLRGAVWNQPRRCETRRDGLEDLDQGRHCMRIVDAGCVDTASALQVIGVERVQCRGDILHRHAWRKLREREWRICAGRNQRDVGPTVRMASARASRLLSAVSDRVDRGARRGGLLRRGDCLLALIEGVRVKP